MLLYSCYKNPQEEGVAQDANVTNIDLYDFRITSTRGAITPDDFFPEISEETQHEIDEGIHWKQETIH